MSGPDGAGKRAWVGASDAAGVKILWGTQIEIPRDLIHIPGREGVVASLSTLHEDGTAANAMLVPFPRHLTGEMLNGTWAGGQFWLRNQNSAHFGNQVLVLARLLRLQPFQHQHEQPQGSHWITHCVVSKET